jgi:Periplasmic copper-binding protein (NosD)/Glycosyl hydrolase family 1
VRTLQVCSSADSGPGTLRQALLDARRGDTITFDPAVFPPDNPVSIAVTSEFPWLSQGHVTIDASDAGVILDGSEAGGEWTGGVTIDSEWNALRGLQIVHFTGAGIILRENAAHNVIGGDREIGSGPLGQGNLSSDNTDGIAVYGASNNTILGNLIGTDTSSTNPWPNRGAGVFLQDGARGNVIGPSNVIAYHNDTGIDIRSADSTGNTFTRNSIHDNLPEGIRLTVEASGIPIPPVIFDFDLQAGIVAGATCPTCVVEIFSGDGSEGEAYEGSITANQNGAFSLNTGSPFTGPVLTATATGLDGSTSAFSAPTSGTRQFAILQEGDDLPKARLVTKRLGELADNRIGDMFPLDPISCPEPDEQNWSLAHVGFLGLKWVRLSLDRFELDQARSMDDYSQFEINECQDEIVTLLAENDITILYTIVYWDETLHAENYPDYGNEEEVQRFLDYTRLIVRHFKDRIQYYEILNEAVHFVDLADYVNLIHRVVPVIREEDPEVKIVVGGATDLRNAYSSEYLFGVLRSDVMPLVDGIAIHPMYGASPQYDEIRRYYYDYPSLVQEIRDVASAHGFSGEYFAEEMSWRTSINPNPYEPWEYTAPVAAKYYARGIVMNLGMDLWAGIGGEMYDTIPPIVKAVQNLSTSMAGARPADLNVDIQSEATNIMSYAFSLPNGDMLLALWTNGVAVDEDPGVSTTLTFPGYSAQKAVGIDVLNGFEQELITGTENGNLLIRNLLVKDYPAFLRLTP